MGPDSGGDREAPRSTQPRLNDLLRGRINKFSLDALINVATAAGLAVRVEVVKAA